MELATNSMLDLDKIKLNVIKWDINTTCNLRCKHCMLSGLQCDSPTLSRQSKLEIAKRLVSLGVQKVIFQSMEPLLDKDIVDLVDYLSRHDIITGIVTNGTLLTDDLISRLIENGLDQITISLDGISPASHDYIRGKGSFNRTLYSINKLTSAIYSNKSPLEIAIELCLHKNNLNEVVKMPDFFSNLDIAVLNVGYIAELGNAIDNNISCTIAEYNNAIETICEIYQSMQYKNYKLIPKSLMPFHCIYLNFKYGMTLPIFYPSCTTVGSTMSIDECGNIRACNFLKNQLDQPFESMIRDCNMSSINKLLVSSKIYFLKKIRDRKNDNRCLSCDHNNQCTFCPLSSEKDINTMVDNCNLYRLKLNEIASLPRTNNHLDFNQKVYCREKNYCRELVLNKSYGKTIEFELSNQFNDNSKYCFDELYKNINDETVFHELIYDGLLNERS